MNDLAFVRDILTPVTMRQSYRNGMAEKLAGIITDLVNENEPLLKATRDGTEITVTERGGPMAFEISIAPLSGQEIVR
jgi:prevent-host-death family protein